MEEVAEEHGSHQQDEAVVLPTKYEKADNQETATTQTEGVKSVESEGDDTGSPWIRGNQGRNE